MAANGENNAVNRPQDAPHHEFVERLRLTGRLLLKKIDCLENGRDGDKTLEWLAEQLDKMDPDNSDHLFEINSAVAYAKGYLNGKRDPPRTFHCYCYQIQVIILRFFFFFLNIYVHTIIIIIISSIVFFFKNMFLTSFLWP